MVVSVVASGARYYRMLFSFLGYLSFPIQSVRDKHYTTKVYMLDHFNSAVFSFFIIRNKLTRLFHSWSPRKNLVEFTVGFRQNCHQRAQHEVLKIFLSVARFSIETLLYDQKYMACPYFTAVRIGSKEMTGWKKEKPKKTTTL